MIHVMAQDLPQAHTLLERPLKNIDPIVVFMLRVKVLLMIESFMVINFSNFSILSLRLVG